LALLSIRLSWPTLNERLAQKTNLLIFFNPSHHRFHSKQPFLISNLKSTPTPVAKHQVYIHNNPIFNGELFLLLSVEDNYVIIYYKDKIMKLISLYVFLFSNFSILYAQDIKFVDCSSQYTEQQQQPVKTKQRKIWKHDEDLKNLFLSVHEDLPEGCKTPTNILNEMKKRDLELKLNNITKDLKKEQVSSHLQKYRNRKKKEAAAAAREVLQDLNNAGVLNDAGTVNNITINYHYNVFINNKNIDKNEENIPTEDNEEHSHEESISINTKESDENKGNKLNIRFLLTNTNDQIINRNEEDTSISTEESDENKEDKLNIKFLLTNTNDQIINRNEEDTSISTEESDENKKDKLNIRFLLTNTNDRIKIGNITN
jgi:hypothetical protein